MHAVGNATADQLAVRGGHAEATNSLWLACEALARTLVSAPSPWPRPRQVNDEPLPREVVPKAADDSGSQGEG